ncbi:hypothetical protein GCM10009609_21550 [Pseudonocardia aurantiaca]
MYTSESDSGYVARLESGWDMDPLQGGGDRWEDGLAPRPEADDAAAGVARRLQGRLDRHLWLLDRLAAEQHPEPPELPELLDTAARMRRDSESLLLLCGQEPGVRPTGPRRLEELMGDAVALAEEPRRIEVRPAPAATIGSAAAVEFLHVLAELVDQTTAAHPGAHLELVGRIESGGATADVLVDGAAGYDREGTGGHRAAAAAEELSRRSRYGIALHRPLGGPPPSGSGLIASVHCPPAAVTVEEPEPDEPPVTRTGGGFPQYANGPGPLGVSDTFDVGDTYGSAVGGGLAGLGAALGNRDLTSSGLGNGSLGNGSSGNGSLGSGLLGNGGLDSRGLDYAGVDYGAPDYEAPDYEAPDYGGLDHGAPDYGGLDHGAPDHGGLDHWDPSDRGPGSDGFDAWRNGLGTPNGNGNGTGFGTGYSNGNGIGHSELDVPTPPAFSPAPSSQVDELFGPLLDLPLEPIDDRYATPIFEAIASAWFREGDGDSGADRTADPQRGPTDWETPQDTEWREAAARAARSEPIPTTASGLPRRRPGNQLVPPPRTQSGLPSGGPGERVPDRVPDRVRDRLSTYQRGLRHGRHRAPGQEAPEPEDW